MKKILVLAFMILCTVSLFAETQTEPMVGDYGALKRSIVFPEAALRAGKGGKVIIAVFIDSTGKATKTKIMESKNPSFDQSAIDAVMMYDDYIPASIDNKPVGCWLLIPINFSLPFSGPTDKNRYIYIDCNADELKQNIINVQKEYKYFGDATVKTEVSVDKYGNITKVLPFDTDDYIVDVIITKAIQNTKFIPATHNGKNTDGFINLYISLSLPTENFDFDFDGKTNIMNVIEENKFSSMYFSDLQNGYGDKIKNGDTIKLECTVYNNKQNQLNTETFATIYADGVTNKFLNKYMMDMKAGSERLVWSTGSSYYKKEFESYTKKQDFIPLDNVFIKIKVLEINPK